MIRGWQKTSFIDYPGKISTVLFYSGCNFRCEFCHNPDLVFNRQGLPKYDEEHILNYLEKRQKIIEAVVLSGGEPTIYRNLPIFLKKLKKTSLLIKLDTNGTNPEMVKMAIKENLVDYLAMDIKAPIIKYPKITNKKVSTEKIKQSISVIINSGLPYEFRSTILPYFHKSKDVLAMARLIKGADIYYLQKFVARGDLVNKNILDQKGYSTAEMEKIARQCRRFVKKCLIR